MHINFDPDSVNWDEFFESQAGSGYYFEGLPYQRGFGIGAIFGNLFRFLLPLGKIIGREFGKEGLALGGRVISDLGAGKNIKESLKSQTKEGLKNLVENVYEKAQTGTGRKKSIKEKKKIRRKKILRVRKQATDFLSPFNVYS